MVMRFVSASFAVISVGAFSFFGAATGCGLTLEGTAPDAPDAQSANDVHVPPPGEEDASDGRAEPSTYAVGGTVTGLAGTNLVLENNGADPIVVLPNADGTARFEFQTRLLAGASYAVKVRTQPETPEQTCTVTGGEGVIDPSTPAVVAVGCTTNRYPVSGTVSGLNGTGLTLSLGSEQATVSASAPTFKFPLGVESGKTYAVTIAANPTNLWQTCAVVANATGSVTNAPITDVGVACTTNSYDLTVNVGGSADDLVTVSSGSGQMKSVILAGAPLAGTGTVTFSLQSGTTYNVTAISSRGTCTPVGPTPSSGTIAGSGVTVNVQCLQIGPFP